MASRTTQAQHTRKYCYEKFEGVSEIHLSEYTSTAKADKEHISQMQMTPDSMLTTTIIKVFLCGIGDQGEKLLCSECFWCIERCDQLKMPFMTKDSQVFRPLVQRRKE